MPEKPISIREAEAGDMATLVRLKQQIHGIHVAYDPAVYSAMTDEEAVCFFEESMKEESTKIFVAVIQEEVVGHMITKAVERPAAPGRQASGSLLIDEICVDAEHRRQGIGRLLIEKAKELALSQGLQEVTLQVWDCNLEAVAFYKSLGMRTDYIRMSMRIEKGEPVIR
jgi:diamine N-acetyltransferase